MTPLLKAASTGMGDVVKVLVWFGADFTRLSKRGVGLMYYTFYNSPSTFQYVSELRDESGAPLEWVDPEPKDQSDRRKENNFSKLYWYV